jgi:hypothetical protein
MKLEDYSPKRKEAAMAKLFVSYVTQDPGKPITFGHMVLHRGMPRDSTDVSYLQMLIYNGIPKEQRPISFPAIVSFQALPE